MFFKFKLPSLIYYFRSHTYPEFILWIMKNVISLVREFNFWVKMMIIMNEMNRSFVYIFCYTGLSKYDIWFVWNKSYMNKLYTNVLIQRIYTNSKVMEGYLILILIIVFQIFLVFHLNSNHLLKNCSGWLSIP